MRASKKSILLAHDAGFVPSSWDDWAALVRCAARLQRLAECRCNGSPLRGMVTASTPTEIARKMDAKAQAEEDRYERLDEAASKRAADLAARLGLEIDLNGDPRGAVVKVRGQGIKGNSWGGEGWFCVG